MLDTTPYTEKLPSSLNEVLKIFTGNESVMVRYLQPKDGVKGKSGNCHLNVKTFIDKRGGNSVSGWLLNRHKTFLEKGIYVWSFHSVWQTPKGNLVDVTEDKHYVGRDKSIFIQDQHRVPDLENGLSYNNIVIFTDSAFAQYFGQSIGKNIASNTPYWCDSSLRHLLDINEHSGIYRLVTSAYPDNIKMMCDEIECDLVDRRLVPREGSKRTLDDPPPKNFIFDYSMKIG